MTPAAKKTHFRRPLGLALSGGGALGAWEASCLESLIRSGLSFDHVTGFSAGALTATAYFLGRMEELLERWNDIDNHGILKFSPRLSPFTMFSGRGLRESISYTEDEERAKRRARCDMSIACLRSADDKPVYFRFSPGGKLWDVSLNKALYASCAIPSIFPPEVIDGKVYVDGGVPGVEPLSFECLEGCADVIVLEMVREEQTGKRTFLPWRHFEQKAFDLLRSQMSAGVASLARLPKPPRIYRLPPSSVLDIGMLEFKISKIKATLEQGYADGEAFIADPERFRVSGPEGRAPVVSSPALKNA